MVPRMMAASQDRVDRDRRRRGATLAGVIALHAAAIALLVAVRLPGAARPAERASVLLDLSAPMAEPDPPPTARKPRRPPRPSAESAPANRHARPSPIVAPPAPVIAPAPIAAAPVAAMGNAPSAGASDRSGPGTGAGGIGQGLGSGKGGTGDGGGGGSGTRARRIKGGINISDYPREAARLKAGGTVIVHLDVGTDGRVKACRVAVSSRNAELDRTTCRLATQRFRYRPATDGEGRAVPDLAGWRQDWWLAPRE